MTKSFESIERTVVRYGLKPATERTLPLFTMSCIAHGYLEILYKQLGFSYEAVGAIGKDNWFHSLMNETEVGRQTGEFIDAHRDNLEEVLFEPAERFVSATEKALNIASEARDPLDGLVAIVEIYPSYTCAIGMYNCLWRFIGNEEKKGMLSERDIKTIGEKRNIVAKVYPQVEKALLVISRRAGEMGGYDGDLLRYTTHTEMVTFLAYRKMAGDKFGELILRRDGYFLLRTIDEAVETIVTDSAMLESIRDKFYSVDSQIVKEIKGHPAQSGIAQGVVFLHGPGVLQGKKIPDVPFIIVSASTHPDDLPIMKSAVAIVTDEGGILSHAAIVSRELKKPCIIGTKIATKVLKDGDLVEVDAEKGIVRIIEKAK